MRLIPEKHRAIAHEWVNGKEIQYKDKFSIEWNDYTVNATPSWHADIEYRVKPAKKYIWVLCNSKVPPTNPLKYTVSSTHVSEAVAFDSWQGNPWTIVSKIDASMIEAED